MALLIYASPMSLDGFIARDEYNWSNPGDEGHAFITDLMRPVGTYLYGRKMYDTMKFWEAPEGLEEGTAEMDFARMWQAADKIVFSKTAATISAKKTRIEREFDPQTIRDLKMRLPHHISVGGPEIAAHAFRAGLVDEVQLFVVPMAIGGGIPVLPREMQIKLELIEERRFGAGWVFLRHRVLR